MSEQGSEYGRRIGACDFFDPFISSVGTPDLLLDRSLPGKVKKIENRKENHAGIFFRFSFRP